MVRCIHGSNHLYCEVCVAARLGADIQKRPHAVKRLRFFRPETSHPEMSDEEMDRFLFGTFMAG